MKSKTKLYLTLLLVGIVGLAITVYSLSLLSQKAPAPDKGRVTIFKSMSCGCCGVYSQYMDRKGFEVKVINTENPDETKNRYNIPSSMQSCHTTVIGDYFVEGHVPVEAIEKLLAEKPEIAGIAMPGMPSGAPGMPGSKEGAFVVYSINKEGAVGEFMRI